MNQQQQQQQQQNGLPIVNKDGKVINSGANGITGIGTGTGTGTAAGTTENDDSKNKGNDSVDWRQSGVQLYVGKLCKAIDDNFFLMLLNACGTVKTWKRMKDTFGFVTFEDPEGAMRCLKLLNGKVLYNTEILVCGYHPMLLPKQKHTFLFPFQIFFFVCVFLLF